MSKHLGIRVKCKLCDYDGPTDSALRRHMIVSISILIPNTIKIHKLLLSRYIWFTTEKKTFFSPLAYHYGNKAPKRPHST